MKNLILLLLLLSSCIQLHAQRVVIDRKHLAIVNENGAVRLSSEMAHTAQLKGIGERLADIKLNLGAVALSEEMIYRSLSEVNQGLRDALIVRDIGQIAAGIFSQSEQILALARDHPQLLLFAEESCRQLKSRGMRLVSEVGELALKEQYGLLLDQQKRDALLKKISLELKVIRALLYSISKTMYWAKVNGLLKSANPYGGFINTDRRLAEQILSNYKTLKR
ncbi:hypothetical protein EZ449_14245 [Pedobacter frigidisoli]|uniref:Uncharacterized protein n=1 Tax=Pedobacter frigidisoli TaxID=2530455 RepID=A0A4R0P2B1_9SPHI|nr:hypothetical protein [Pedobacter frigidisoli]TCD07692.1 hypothetical protein EZ449_14245 [Pedobacter frigidisoli]